MLYKQCLASAFSENVKKNGIFSITSKAKKVKMLKKFSTIESLQIGCRVCWRRFWIKAQAVVLDISKQANASSHAIMGDSDRQ